MFGFLKKKIQEAVSIFTKKAVQEPAETLKDAPDSVAAAKDAADAAPKTFVVTSVATSAETTSEYSPEYPSQIIEKPVGKPVKTMAEQRTDEEMAEETKAGPKAEQKKEQFKDKTIIQKSIIQENVQSHINQSKSEKIQETGSIAGSIAEPIAEEVMVKEEIKEESIKEESKPGFFQRIAQKITTVQISEQKFEELFEELELAMLEGSVAVEVIDKIKSDLKNELTSKSISRSGVEKAVSKALSASIKSLFHPGFDIVEKISESEKSPYVILFVGINGSGKTTTIAKLAHKIKANGASCVLAAADTFRAAAIVQLEEHGKKLGIKVIKHDYGSDPAAVAFDAIQYAKAHSIKAVLIDTAGRLHSNNNLIDEMKKIIRVARPDLTLFVGEAITGNDCVEQARIFSEAADIDGIVLAKADIDEKGGASVSISYVTGKPILYIGTGQGYDDLKQFNPNDIVESLGLES